MKNFLANFLLTLLVCSSAILFFDFAEAQSCPNPVCISNIQVVDRTPTSVRVTWTTNVPATSQVRYWISNRNVLYEPNIPMNARTSHSITLNNLQQATTYFFKPVSVVNNFEATVPNGYSQFTTPSTSSQNAPVQISGESVGSITADSVTVTWTTNVPATSQVKYGLTTRNMAESAKNTNLTTSHRVVLTGLSPRLPYYYQVLSEANGFSAQGSSRQFTTAAGPCTDPVCISNLQATNVTQTSVTITWTTSVPADTQVKYGPTPRLGLQTPLNAAPMTSHSVNVTGLNPGMLYYFEANSVSVTLNNFRARSSVQVTMGGTLGGPITGDPGKDVSFGFKLTNPWSGVNNIFDAIDKITDFLITIAVPIAVILIVYAGILFLTSAGNTGKVTQAKTILGYVIIGFAVLLIGKGFFLLIESVLNLGA